MSDLLKLSVSKTKSYLDCKAKYRFSYILKLPKKERDFHIFGKFIHKILEDFHNEYINGSTEQNNKVMARVYKKALEEYKSKLSKEHQEEAYDIIDRYLKLLSEQKDTTKILSVEKDFNISLSEKLILNGMIDRVQLDSDGVYHVCDYKTVKNKKYLKNDFMQLLTYAYVILLDNPSIEKVRGSYILLRHNFEYITKEFSVNEIKEMEKKYKDYAKSIEEEQLWRPNPTPLCAYCDFTEHCESGQEFLNRTGNNKNNKNGLISW